MAWLMSDRPPFIIASADVPEDVGRYPGSDEILSVGTHLSAPFGFKRIAARHELIPPGRRTSWPHAHSVEEELCFVLEGTPDHRDSVLSEAERTAGRTMMICCSGCKSDLLILDI